MPTPIIAELNKERYCLIRLPEGAIGFAFDRNVEYWLRYYPKNYKDIHDTRVIELPKSNWSIIGLGKDLSEEQWKEIVERSLVMSIKYKDYECVKSSFHTATQSGLSWLKSLNADENYLILKQQK